MNDLCSQLAYSGVEGDSGLDELTSRVSKWSATGNLTVDELTAQFIGFSLNPLQPAQKSERRESRPVESFPEQESLGINPLCRFCFNQLKDAVRIGIGWKNETQCEGCGLSDQGLAWRDTQRKEDWKCWICIEDRNFERTHWQFPTKWDACQFSVWLVESKAVPGLMGSSVFESSCIEDEITKYHDTRMNVFDSLREWHLRNKQLFDPAAINHTLEHMVVYETLCQATESYEKTFLYCDDRWRYGLGYTDPYEGYVKEHPLFYFNSIVWLKIDARWAFIKRRPGESNYALYCRAYGLEKTLDDEEFDSLKFKKTPEQWAFDQACMSRTKERGRICLHSGFWCWLPQSEDENPDQFEKRAKQFETVQATRTKRTFEHYDNDGNRRFKETTYTQEPDETLAQFFARFKDAPGEEVRKREHGMILDWAA